MKKIILITAAIFAYCILVTANCFSQGTAINTTGSAADNSALLDLSSTSKGLLIPRMTSTERNNISSPSEGLLVYNLTSKCFEAYNSSVQQWVSFGCIGCQLPGAFAATAASSVNQTSFSANWNISAGATNYYLDVSTDASFSAYISGYNNLSVGNFLTYNVTGLTCETGYYYRVRAENTCGTGSNSNTVSVTTSLCWSCGSTLQRAHIASGGVAPVDKTVDYGTVLSSLSGASKCWITQNLGSSNQAGSATDGTEAAAGWYFQFNRKQGYKHDGATRTPNTTWITSIDENSNWTSGEDPCTILLGSGWRIPTLTEWTNTDNNAGWTNRNDAYNSVFKLHAGGVLLESNGSLEQRTENGLFWSSDQFGTTQCKPLFICATCCEIGCDMKARGHSLRCIKD